jgi:hypothetical protein
LIQILGLFTLISSKLHLLITLYEGVEMPIHEVGALHLDSLLSVKAIASISNLSLVAPISSPFHLFSLS